MEPTDPDFAARVRASFARQRIMGVFGATLAHVGPGTCEIAWPFDAGFTQQHGYAHAAVTATLADSAAGYAAYSLMPADSSVVTVTYTIQLVAPARGDALVARARVTHAGRSLYSAQADVFGLTGGTETLVATLVATIKCLHGRADT